MEQGVVGACHVGHSNEAPCCICNTFTLTPRTCHCMSVNVTLAVTVSVTAIVSVSLCICVYFCICVLVQNLCNAFGFCICLVCLGHRLGLSTF